jgi:Zn-dependent peptidase ImmA (M78 family)
LAKSSILRRGFKTEAEQKAKFLRIQLNLHPCAPLCAFQLGRHLDIPIFSATEFLSKKEDIDILKGKNGNESEWSALTMDVKSGKQIIIHNPFNSAQRQQSDLMHEFAHIICKHKREQENYDFEIPFGMREFNDIQEEEAICLGSTLQLPTPALLWAKKRKMTYENIAVHFNASIEMVNYRMRITGIGRYYNI